MKKGYILILIVLGSAFCNVTSNAELAKSELLLLKEIELGACELLVHISVN